MRIGAPLWLVAGFVTISGCARQETVACAPDPRYGTARSAQAVQIPDDLSPPNESDALRLPPAAAPPSRAGECLETPPSFFAEGRPFQVVEELSRRERRQARREERRQDGAEAPANSSAPAAEDRAPPAGDSPPPASADDRVIDN